MSTYESPSEQERRERSEYAKRLTRMELEREERQVREEAERLERECPRCGLPMVDAFGDPSPDFCETCFQEFGR